MRLSGPGLDALWTEWAGALREDQVLSPFVLCLSSEILQGTASKQWDIPPSLSPLFSRTQSNLKQEGFI